MGFMAPAALGLGALGGITSAIGSIFSGNAQAAASNYQAQVANNNAIIANQNANYATQAGQEQAAQQSLKNAGTLGQIKTGEAASGIDVNTGSAVNVQKSQRELGQLDASNVLNNAELQAYGYRAQATNFTAQGQLDTMQAQEAPIGADLSAGGGLLSTFSGTGFNFAKLGGANPFGS